MKINKKSLAVADIPRDALCH